MNKNFYEKSSPRLNIFDGLRGHLLIGMLIAHLSFQDGLEWLRNFHHNRLVVMYDAEFFVLIAGILVGHLWSKVYKSNISFKSFISKRLVTIYKYYLLSAFPFFAASIYGGADFLEIAFGIVSMQLGGWYSDILPIYFVCFVLLYLCITASWIRSNIILVVASTGIYAASQITNFGGFFGFSGKFVVFDIAAWQFLFVCSIMMGRHALGLYQWIKEADEIVIAAIMFLLVIISVILRYNNFYPDLLINQDGSAGINPRMGLHPIYLIRIAALSLIIAVILIRHDVWIRPFHKIAHWYLGLKIIKNVGKYSIQMFVIHVYIMALYKASFSDTPDETKSVFAVLWITIFILVPSLWVAYKQRFQGFIPSMRHPSS